MPSSSDSTFKDTAGGRMGWDLLPRLPIVLWFWEGEAFRYLSISKLIYCILEENLNHRVVSSPGMQAVEYCIAQYKIEPWYYKGITKYTSIITTKLMEHLAGKRYLPFSSRLNPSHKPWHSPPPCTLRVQQSLRVLLGPSEGRRANWASGFLMLFTHRERGCERAIRMWTNKRGVAGNGPWWDLSGGQFA